MEEEKSKERRGKEENLSSLCCRHEHDFQWPRIISIVPKEAAAVMRIDSIG